MDVGCCFTVRKNMNLRDSATADKTLLQRLFIMSAISCEMTMQRYKLSEYLQNISFDSLLAAVIRPTGTANRCPLFRHRRQIKLL